MRIALYLAIGLAVAPGGVAASFAQDPQAPDPGKSVGAGIAADARQAHDATPEGPGSEGREPASAGVAVPIGRVRVGPEFVDGEPVYERRLARGAMTSVDVSTTPFAPEFPGVYELVLRPDQPAPW